MSRVLVEPKQKKKLSPAIIVMIVSLAVLLLAILGVGYAVQRKNTAPPPSAPMTPEPTGTPVLPVAVGQYQREPGAGDSDPGLGIDRSVLTSSAVYNQEGRRALIVVGARPVDDPRKLMEQVGIRAITDVDGGWCGRDSNDLDMCVVQKARTAIFVEGLRSQEKGELIRAGREISLKTN